MVAGNIILIGMPGAGKSTIGVLLAKACGHAFVDTDLLIQDREGLLLQQIVDRHGHMELRRIESEVCSTLALENSVVATGGSVVYCAEAMQRLAGLGTVVWLQLPLPLVIDRLGDFGARGLAKSADQTIADLFNEREPLYRRYADITIACEGLTPEACVAAILARLASCSDDRSCD
jgi:shikimate kinase